AMQTSADALLGAGKGHAAFDPLMLDLDGISPGLTDLFKKSGVGQLTSEVDLVGLKAHDNQTDEVYHLELDGVVVAGVAVDNDNTAVALYYEKASETISEQQPDGSFGNARTVSFDLDTGGERNLVDPDALAAMAHDGKAPDLHYLVKFNGVEGTSQLPGYEG